MSIDTFDTFLAVLRRTKLLASEQIEDIARELVPLYSGVQSLGEYLVEIDWLTAYQLHKILAEEWNELTFGPFQILDQLGQGGISEVFKAWDTAHGRLVALKVLRPDLTDRSDVVHQFQRELHAVTRLNHANIIKTFEAQQEAGVHYFAMEFVEGMDLERYVSQVGPLPIDQACDYARQAAQGLQHAHQLGLVHRDIKPANLFLLHPPLAMPNQPGGRRGPDPVVKIIDWGLARCVREEGGDQGIALSPEENEAEKSSLVGTADYISPEQSLDPTLVDIRSDIYSLGCTLYYLLTAHPPFQGNSVLQKLLQHREVAPPSIRKERPELPEELEALMMRMLAKAPEDRPQIPLLVVTPLRRFCMAVANISSHGGVLLRPSSSGNLPRPGSAPGTAINLPRPGTNATLSRPGTQPVLPRPSGRNIGAEK
ncbi:MAG: serine/threonine-protein kinase [Gemmataceae bacterium]